MQLEKKYPKKNTGLLSSFKKPNSLAQNSPLKPSSLSSYSGAQKTEARQNVRKGNNDTAKIAKPLEGIGVNPSSPLLNSTLSSEKNKQSDKTAEKSKPKTADLSKSSSSVPKTGQEELRSFRIKKEEKVEENPQGKSNEQVVKDNLAKQEQKTPITTKKAEQTLSANVSTNLSENVQSLTPQKKEEEKTVPIGRVVKSSTETLLREQDNVLTIEEVVSQNIANSFSSPTVRGIKENFPKKEVELKPIAFENAQVAAEVNTPEQYALAKERVAGRKSKLEEATSAWQWSFTVRPTSVITGLFVMLITLGFFFTFGLIVGRGLTPTAVPLSLASIVPNDSTSIDVEADILKPEDLQYARVLKDEVSTDPIVMIPVVNTQSPATPVAQVPTPQGLNGNVPYPIGTPQQIAPIPGEAVVETPKEPQKYDFVVKAASFTNEKSADDLRQKLEGEGLRTQLIRETIRGKNWFFVHINFRGTEQALQTIQKGLSKYAIRDSIVMSKTPV